MIILKQMKVTHPQSGFLEYGKQNEKEGFKWWQRLGGKRHTEQSEKHVTVYPLEYGFQVTWADWSGQQKREQFKGVGISQRR